MGTRITLIVIIGLFAGFFGHGCSEDTPLLTPPLEQLDGAALLGLQDNRTLSYLQVDSVITIDSAYHVTVTTSVKTITLSGGGNDWIVRSDSQAILNLKLTDEAVIQTGYWRKIDGNDSLIYFSEPVVVMPRSLSSQPEWSGFTPFFNDGDGDIAYLFYYSYFGFFFEKHLVDTVTVLLPAGSFATYRFDTELFVASGDTIPLVQVSEYYSPDRGLVKLTLRGGALRRTLSLTDMN